MQYDDQAINIIMGRVITYLRIAKGLNRENCAESLGISVEEVRENELGKRPITLSQLYHYAKALEFQPEPFLEIMEKYSRMFPGPPNN